MAVAEFERGIIRERVNAGLAAARQRGVRLGRPATAACQADTIQQLKGQGMGIRAIARKLRISPTSVCRILEPAV
jgi:DNA invertase Pin-like site-specific DNA recombinase